MTGEPVVLVMAKAPVPGRAKTRLAVHLGPVAAADLAAAALLDTLDACEGVFGSGRVHLALAGRLADAARGREIRERLAGWTVHDQRGEGFGERLAHAHHDVGRHAGAPVVQIGMDTPHVTGPDLEEVARLLATADAVLGHAPDGGWWVLGLRDPGRAAALTGVPMSTAQTGARTEAALAAAGAGVARTRVLRDVDTVEDAAAVAALAPDSRFARAWAALRQDDR